MPAAKCQQIYKKSLKVLLKEFFRKIQTKSPILQPTRTSAGMLPVSMTGRRCIVVCQQVTRQIIVGKMRMGLKYEKLENYQHFYVQ